jgi:CRP-like cAMP-binding protein
MHPEIGIDAVQAFRCFRNLSDQNARTLAEVLDPLRLSAGEELFHQGASGDSAFFLVQGTIAIQVVVPGGSDRNLAQIHPGAIIGEISLLTYEPRTATAVAVEDSTLWRITREALQLAVSEGEVWATQFLMATAQTLANRLGLVNKQLVRTVASQREAEPRPEATATAELERLRQRLFSEWSF